MIEKITELKKMMSNEDILSNLFLNYSSFKNNDIIFILKKELSKNLKIDIKDIRLIGSGHTGFRRNLENKIEKIEEIKDYDFVIINKELFQSTYNYIDSNNLYLEKIQKYPIFKNQKTPREIFEQNYKNGKLHLRYIDKKFYIIKICKRLDEILQKKFNINLKVSCCIYETEANFIKNQKKYYLNLELFGGAK
ncbi:MAG: hypothetical protein ACRC0G_03590 [Fusobacteriaceae bacterium]